MESKIQRCLIVCCLLLSMRLAFSETPPGFDFSFGPPEVFSVETDSTSPTETKTPVDPFGGEDIGEIIQERKREKPSGNVGVDVDFTVPTVLSEKTKTKEDEKPASVDVPSTVVPEIEIPASKSEEETKITPPFGGVVQKPSFVKKPSFVEEEETIKHPVATVLVAKPSVPVITPTAPKPAEKRETEVKIPKKPKMIVEEKPKHRPTIASSEDDGMGSTGMEYTDSEEMSVGMFGMTPKDSDNSTSIPLPDGLPMTIGSGMPTPGTGTGDVPMATTEKESKKETGFEIFGLKSPTKPPKEKEMSKSHARKSDTTGEDKVKTMPKEIKIEIHADPKTETKKSIEQKPDSPAEHRIESKEVMKFAGQVVKSSTVHLHEEETIKKKEPALEGTEDVKKIEWPSRLVATGELPTEVLSSTEEGGGPKSAYHPVIEKEEETKEEGKEPGPEAVGIVTVPTPIGEGSNMTTYEGVGVIPVEARSTEEEDRGEHGAAVESEPATEFETSPEGHVLGSERPELRQPEPEPWMMAGEPEPWMMAGEPEARMMARQPEPVHRPPPMEATKSAVIPEAEPPAPELKQPVQEPSISEPPVTAEPVKTAEASKSAEPPVTAEPVKAAEPVAPPKAEEPPKEPVKAAEPVAPPKADEPTKEPVKAAEPVAPPKTEETPKEPVKAAEPVAPPKTEETPKKEPVPVAPPKTEETPKKESVPVAPLKAAKAPEPVKAAEPVAPPKADEPPKKPVKAAEPPLVSEPKVKHVPVPVTKPEPLPSPKRATESEKKSTHGQGPIMMESLDALKTYLESTGADPSGIKTGVITHEGRVGLLISEDVKLKNMHITIAEPVDVLIQLSGGSLELDGVTVGPARRGSRRALRRTTKLKTGLNVVNGSTVTIKDSSFEASGESMVVVKEGSSFFCSNCLFRGNRGTDGGAIRIEDSFVRIKDSKMIGNTAEKGGAIYLSSDCKSPKTTLTIIDTFFEGNEAHERGAGIFADCADEVTLIGSVFGDGSAGIGGGGVYLGQVEGISIEKCKFESNRAETSGGALMVDRAATMSIVSCTFRENVATNSIGGAAYVLLSNDITVRDTKFDRNRAAEGGALSVVESYATHGRLFLQKNIFEENWATRQGGALVVKRVRQNEIVDDEQSSYVKISQNQFSGNVAKKGGAVFVTSEGDPKQSLMIAVMDTTFTQNKAQDVGGGVYCGEHASIDVSSSHFGENAASTGVNYAAQCGCTVTVSSTDLLVADGSDNKGALDLCTVDGKKHPASAQSSKGTMLYVYLALGAIAAFLLVAVVVVVKKKRALGQEYSRRVTHRSLSTGGDQQSNLLSVSLLPRGLDGDRPRGEFSRMTSQNFGEMDYYIPEGDEQQAESFDAFDGQQEGAELQQAATADDAFFDDALNWKNDMAPHIGLSTATEIANRPTESVVAAHQPRRQISEIVSHPTASDFDF